MRRTLPLLVTATSYFAACSGSDDNASDTSLSRDRLHQLLDTNESAPDTQPTSDLYATDKPEVEVPDEIPTELQSP